MTSDLEQFIAMCQRANIACVTGKTADAWGEVDTETQQAVCMMSDDGKLVMGCLVFDLHGRLVDVVRE